MRRYIRFICVATITIVFLCSSVFANETDTTKKSGKTAYEMLNSAIEKKKTSNTAYKFKGDSKNEANMKFYYEINDSITGSDRQFLKDMLDNALASVDPKISTSSNAEGTVNSPNKLYCKNIQAINNQTDKSTTEVYIDGASIYAKSNKQTAWAKTDKAALKAMIPFILTESGNTFSSLPSIQKSSSKYYNYKDNVEKDGKKYFVIEYNPNTSDISQDDSGIITSNLNLLFDHYQLQSIIDKASTEKNLLTSMSAKTVHKYFIDADTLDLTHTERKIECKIEKLNLELLMPILSSSIKLSADMSFDISTTSEYHAAE